MLLSRSENLMKFYLNVVGGKITNLMLFINANGNFNYASFGGSNTHV